MSKIATRDGFGDEIVELGRENKNILVVDVDIGKSCKTTNFASSFLHSMLTSVSPSRAAPASQRVWRPAARYPSS